MNRLTLAFDDAELERDFLDKLARRLRSRVRIGAVASFIFFVAFWAWDVAMLPPSYRAFSQVYPFYLTASIALFVVTFIKRDLSVGGWTTAIASFSAIFIGALLSIQYRMPQQASARVYNVLVIAALFVQAAWGMRFLHATAITWVGLAAYVLVAAVLRPLPTSEIVDHLLWIVSAAALGMFVGYLLELERRRLFLQQRMTERERTRADVAERARHLAEALLRVNVAPPRGLEAGSVVEDRYRVLRELGKGGMGAVYEVERMADQKHLALKVLSGVADREALVRFAREAQIAAQLDHPNVVSVLDVDVSKSGMLFLVMELVSGSTLAAEKARWGDAGWARPILKQVAQALAAMHARGIVHRDLKPANVLLDGKIAKVADFGIASLRPRDEGDSTITKGMTQTGAFMGTPIYMAPELVKGAREAQPSADLWSFGVMAHELLVGKLPFAEPPVIARLEGRAIRLSIGEPILTGCLNEDPAKRPSALELGALF